MQLTFRVESVPCLAVFAGHIADCRRHMRALEGTFWPFKACNALPGRTDRP